MDTAGLHAHVSLCHMQQANCLAELQGESLRHRPLEASSKAYMPQWQPAKLLAWCGMGLHAWVALVWTQ